MSAARSAGESASMETIEPSGGGVGQAPFEAHLGHATWLCLQDQDEIANRNLFFTVKLNGLSPST